MQVRHQLDFPCMESPPQGGEASLPARLLPPSCPLMPSCWMLLSCPRFRTSSEGSTDVAVLSCGRASCLRSAPLLLYNLVSRLCAISSSGSAGCMTPPWVRRFEYLYGRSTVAACPCRSSQLCGLRIPGGRFKKKARVLSNVNYPRYSWLRRCWRVRREARSSE